MRRVLAVAALTMTALTALTGCGAQSNTGLAARVGEKIISSRQLGGDVTRALALPQFSATDVDRTTVVRDRLTTLIYRALADQAARRLGVVVTGAEVQARLDKFVDNFGGLAELERIAAQNNTPKQDLREALRAGLVQERIGLKLVADVTVSAADLRKAYDENIDRFDQVQLWQIQVRTRGGAEDALRRARAGEDFGKLAGELSVDANSKDRGGFLGFIGRGVLDPPLEKAAFAGTDGELSGPVESSKGWHVLKIGKRRLTTLAQATDDLRLILLQRQTQERLQSYIGNLAKELRITVSPRFGRWDPALLAVNPPPDTLSSPPAGPHHSGQPNPSPVPSP